MNFKVTSATLCAFLVGALLTGPIRHSQAGGQNLALDAAALKEMVKGLGYEVKDLNTEAGKEKIEFTVSKSDFTLPIGAEVSPSKNYVWLTLFLGEVKDTSKVTSAQALALLKGNYKTQPVLFYVTERNNLMVGLATDNRAITPAILRARIDKIADDCVKTAADWQAFGK